MSEPAGEYNCQLTKIQEAGEMKPIQGGNTVHAWVWDSLRPQHHLFRSSIRCQLRLRRAHFPETNFQLEYPDECLFSALDSISWCILQAAIRDSLQRLAVLFELSAAPSLAGAQELRWRLITFFYTETEAVLVHGFNYPEGSYSNSIANLWLCKASKKPDDKVNVSYRSLVMLLCGKLCECCGRRWTCGTLYWIWGVKHLLDQHPIWQLHSWTKRAHHWEKLLHPR